MEKIKEIISENEQIITSRQDSKIFFDAIFQKTKPNSELKKAASEYNHIQKVPPCQFTVEQLKNEINKSLEDIKQNRIISQNQLENEMALW